MKKFLLIIVTVIIGLLFFKLSSNYSERFEDIEDAYKKGHCVNLVKGIEPNKIASLLMANEYVSNKKDAQFIAEQLSKKLEKGQKLATLYDLNKRAWQVPATVIDSFVNVAEETNAKGKKSKKEESAEDSDLKHHLVLSQNSLGVDSLFNTLKVESLKTEVNLGEKNNGKIIAIVKEKDPNANFIKSKLHKDKVPCKEVIVRLSAHYLNKTKDGVKDSVVILGHAKTNADGKAVFAGLDTALSYSVRPIKNGYEYGSAKGTIGGNLSQTGKDDTLTCEFTQQEHRLRMFEATTLKMIKEDQTMTIRSPKEFEDTLIAYLLVYFAMWWGLYLINIRKKGTIDESILSILMLLTGICILTMFSINDPLTDKLLGVDMAQGIIAGVVIIGLLQKVDFVKLYQGQSKVGFDIPLECFKWIFKPFKTKVLYFAQALTDPKKNFVIKILSLVGVVICLPFILLDIIQLTRLSNKINTLLDKLPKGSGYILAALMLTLLLFTPLGASVGGMKVNLNIGILFQPSEIAKYLVIFFMAAYFCKNADNIVKYSEEGNAKLFGAKMKMLAGVVVGLLILMGIYFVLGDMGPALVLAFTFIILYSIIKSKIDLEKVDKSKHTAKIFTCDLAWLIYGILTFLVCLYLGYLWKGRMWVTCLLWFVAWISIGLKRKQIFETAIIFNLIISAFVFGAQMSSVPGFDTVAKRLADRNEMCTNTWGTLPINGVEGDAGENTQVAEGLWGLASGGFTGQGLGNGTPHAIPAFHTDMVLESMGEQLGLFSIISIIILLALLMRKTIVIGYRTTHPFVFYLCLGIAIVTAVQFIIISLGSTGLVPLTGVTVPFFSYGKVSMILNLTAFGIILSISKRNSLESLPGDIAALKKKDMEKYSHSVALLSLAYTIFAIFLCSVFFKYQVLERDEILVRPVYVNNANGVPVIDYNPRISRLTRKMPSGDIYDRNGVLLATSEASKLSEKKHKDVYNSLDLEACDTTKNLSRYYPFGEQMFFMVGDYNSGIFFSSHEKYARGYMAEARHLDTLRGFNNTKYDAQNKPVKVELKSKEYRPDKYFKDDQEYTSSATVVRDYSPIIELLKDGYYYYPKKMISRDIIAKYQDDEKGLSEPNDIQLTVDAELQTKVAQGLEEYFKEKYAGSSYKKARASIVILDAKNGDLITSTSYPIANMDILKSKDLPNRYSDSEKEPTLKAYTDMDLGLFYGTAPGSTAKVMSAMAGFNGCGLGVKDTNYVIYHVDKDKTEKTGLEPPGTVDMWTALVNSSNCYFINLINDKKLYKQLADIYSAVGVSINKEASYRVDYSTYDPNSDWKRQIISQDYKAASIYQRYVKNRLDKEGRPTNIKKMRLHPAWFWAWGQGTMDATPLSMARVASIPANNGYMPITRYLLSDKVNSVQVMKSAEANALNSIMKAESREHSHFTEQNIGGKTGTAERVMPSKTKRQNRRNDAWYMCFVENVKVRTNGQEQTTSLAIALRIERLYGGEHSSHASRFIREHLLDILAESGYTF